MESHILYHLPVTFDGFLKNKLIIAVSCRYSRYVQILTIGNIETLRLFFGLLNLHRCEKF